MRKLMCPVCTKELEDMVVAIRKGVKSNKYFVPIFQDGKVIYQECDEHIINQGMLRFYCLRCFTLLPYPEDTISGYLINYFKEHPDKSLPDLDSMTEEDFEALIQSLRDKGKRIVS